MRCYRVGNSLDHHRILFPAGRNQSHHRQQSPRRRNVPAGAGLGSVGVGSERWDGLWGPRRVGGLGSVWVGSERWEGLWGPRRLGGWRSGGRWGWGVRGSVRAAASGSVEAALLPQVTRGDECSPTLWSQATARMSVPLPMLMPHQSLSAEAWKHVSLTLRIYTTNSHSHTILICSSTLVERTA